MPARQMCSEKPSTVYFLNVYMLGTSVFIFYCACSHLYVTWSLNYFQMTTLSCHRYPVTYCMNKIKI